MKQAAALVAAVLLWGLILSAYSASPAWAAAITQDNATAGDERCTLREAINNANSDSDTTNGDCAAGGATGEDTITFELGSSATVTLDSQLPTITDGDSLSIEGEENEITVSGNDAVSVFVADSGAQLALKDLTVANGAASVGAGIVNDGTLEVTNSTFSSNSADLDGGGIFNNPAASATLRNTIVVNSTSGGNCSGPITDGRYNISSDDTCAFTDPTSKNDTNPKLSKKGLKDRGGPTKTIGIRPKSPAKNAIPEDENGCGTDITEDQRGMKRPKGKGCDIGALEKKRRR